MPGNGRQLLVVDDDALIRLLISTLLSGDGWQVLEAGSLAEAAAVLREESPAAMVLDESLPDGSGLELAARLDGSVHVVLYSGSAHRDLPTGVHVVIPKGGRPEALVDYFATV